MNLQYRSTFYLAAVAIVFAIGFASLFGTMYVFGWGIGGASADETYEDLVAPEAPVVVGPEAPVVMVPTQVCGPYMNPQIVGGMPVEVTANTIRFQDGYVLVLKHAPSMYLDRLGYLQIKDREVEAYALAAEQFNPCPPDPPDPEAGK